MVGSGSSSAANGRVTIPKSSSEETKLGFPRAYSISLSHQFIYTRSNLIPALVSSKAYRQLEFLAVGSWWVYEEALTQVETGEGSKAAPETPKSRLFKIPGGREDVFQDKSIDLRSTRSLMKFLKVAADAEGHALILERWGQTSFPTFLTNQFNIPQRLQLPLIALTSSMNSPGETLTAYALPRIYRHLSSVGIFGPGFGSVIPKWGGLAEVAQVSCRAGAVGGGVYVLRKEVVAIETLNGSSSDQECSLEVHLDGDEKIKTRWVVGTQHELPSRGRVLPSSLIIEISHSVTIVSSALSTMFPTPVEGGSTPAGAVVVFQETQPVYLIIHSSDTGECPVGQCKFPTFLESKLFCFHDDPKQNEYLSTLSAISLEITKTLTV